MTLYEFRMLTDEEQVDLLYNEGTYIGKRKVGEECVILYQLDSFYIELYYKKYRRHILRIYCFQSTVPLDPYLSQIDVEDLVQQ